MDAEEQAELAAMRAEVRGAFPVQTILDEFGSGRKPRDVVLAAGTLLAVELAPPLLAAVEHAATGAELSRGDSGLAFYGLHILGGARDPRLFPALMRILRLPAKQLDRLLGDALTETIKRVAIGSFDGNAQALFDLMADASADEYARAEMFGVAAFLAFEGRIDNEDVRRFLIRFDDERLAPAQHMAWHGWQEATALLALRDLVPRVQAAWRDGRQPERVSEPKYFFRDLKQAETDWGNIARFRKHHRLGYIDDVVDELGWIYDPDAPDPEPIPDLPPGSSLFADDADEPLLLPRWREPDEPYVNPMRHVGRNDPCPCGSGKKAKRCCLAG